MPSCVSFMTAVPSLFGTKDHIVEDDFSMDGVGGGAEHGAQAITKLHSRARTAHLLLWTGAGPWPARGGPLVYEAWLSGLGVGVNGWLCWRGLCAPVQVREPL